MKKIPTIFQRDWNGDRSKVINAPHPDCDWVFAGEGVATRKYDGTSCYWHNNKLWKRRELKPGQTEPTDFLFVSKDEETNKTIGWIPVGNGPEDCYHRHALENIQNDMEEDTTYELLGPKIQGGIEHEFKFHRLYAHKNMSCYYNEPRDFHGLKSWLEGRDIEGLVFHHPDGRMGKIKLRDFGLKRNK